MNPVERISNANNINQSIIMFGAIDAIGTVLLGLGLYGKFGARGDAFHPLLNDPAVVNTLIVVGAILMPLGGFKLMTLIKQKAGLKKSI
jgi:hypothetical protein